MRIDNRYDVQELIGQGGMGEVYRGLDTQTGQEVAIKVLKPEVVDFDPDLVERFVREGEALRRLNHPNIVKMLATADENGRKYIIMEYVPGGSLRELLSQQMLPIERVLALALEIADALTRAHHLRIIHRDIKPGNILLAEDGTPRLTDFGVAHMENMPKMTQTGSMVGTFAYLSPEACRSENLDERTDIWSFGVLLYEMLTGKNPFETRQPASTITAILNNDPADLRTVRPDIPQSLADLVKRMLFKDRTDRIGSVRLVGAELESIIRGLDTPLRAAVNELSELDSSRFDTPLTNNASFVIPDPDSRKPHDEPLLDVRKAKEDARKSKEEARQAKGQARKAKFEMHLDGFPPFPPAPPAPPEPPMPPFFGVKTDGKNEYVNFGFLQVVKRDDGSEHVKIGPLQFIKNADGAEYVNTGAVKFQKDHEGKEQVQFNPVVILVVLAALLFFASACMVFMSLIF